MSLPRWVNVLTIAEQLHANLKSLRQSHKNYPLQFLRSTL